MVRKNTLGDIFGVKDTIKLDFGETGIRGVYQTKIWG
jgi:hypothetical protein